MFNLLKTINTHKSWEFILECVSWMNSYDESLLAWVKRSTDNEKSKWTQTILWNLTWRVVWSVSEARSLICKWKKEEMKEIIFHKSRVGLVKHLQFSSVPQLCPAPCSPMDCSMPGLPVHHQLPELAQTHVHQVGNTIQPSYPLSSPSPPTFNLSQHQGLCSHQVAKVLEFQLQHHSFQWIFRTDFL